MSTNGTSTAAANALFADALRRRNAADACSIYAEQARLMPPAAGALIGRDQIRAFWEAGLSAGMTAISFAPNALGGSGRMSFEAGRYELRIEPIDGAPVVERGHYLHIHERQSNGDWLRIADIFTPGGDG